MSPELESAVSPPTAIRPEDEVLLCCARTEMDAGRAARLRELLRPELDWFYLFLSALRHGMVPLLYRNLNTTCPESVPEDTLEDLRTHCTVYAAENRVLTEEFLRLLRLLAAHGITTVPYKGPALAALAYGDISLRRFGDLDLLVRPQDAQAARALLLSAGYRDSLTDGQAAAALRSRVTYNYKLVREEDGLLVELHWAITSQDHAFPLDLERVWKRLEPITVAGETLLHFQREDLLLILCQHGSKHKWKRLDWICDVAELLRVHPEMEWGSVRERAHRLGCQRMLFLGLCLAEDLLGAALPENVSHQLRADRVVPSLADCIQEGLFAEGEILPRTAERRFFRHRLRERLRDRLPFFLYYLPSYLGRRLTPTAEDRELLPLPERLAFLYYLLRPARLAIKYGAKPFKRLP